MQHRPKGLTVEGPRWSRYGFALVLEKVNQRLGSFSIFIFFEFLIKGKGHQALVQILYEILDKTRNVVVYVDSGCSSVLYQGFGAPSPE